MFGVKFPGHGRPVQSHSFQIFGSGRFQFLDEFIQLLVHGSLLLYAERISPASARAAASKRSSAKTSESTPAPSSTEATPPPRAPAVARPTHPPSAATAARTHESAEKKPKDEPQHREKEKNNKNE